jgi:hypothetical protein
MAEGPVTNIAALIAFLPSRADPVTASHQELFGTRPKPSSLAIAYVLFTILMMGTQWIAASHESTTPDETGPAAAATPPTPLSSAGPR